MPKPNDRIGPYQLISKLGEGQSAEVWLAKNVTALVAREVALKIPLRREVDLDAIRQEADIWAKASGHPNVLPLIEANRYGDYVVIASEYAPSGSLKNWLENHGGLAPSVKAAVKMTRGILAGLEHMHKRNIIHRDLKPANILLQGETPRLADFGIARVLVDTIHSNIIAGTHAYMAPEAHDAVRNQQTDIWSVGVILYEMLAGERPFPQKTGGALIRAITDTEPAPLPEDVPEWLRQVVSTALAKTPARRFQSAAAMRAALVRPMAPPVQETRKLDEPVTPPRIPQPKPPEIVVERPDRIVLPYVEPPTIERSKVIVDLSPKPEAPPKPKSPPSIVRQRGLRQAIIGAGLAAVVIALASYLATEMPSTVSPGSWNPVGDSAQPAAVSGINLANGVKVQMVSLSGGEFTMGGDRYDNEKPPHRVKVSPFAIGKTEVTQAQWKAVMGGNPSGNQGDTLPVENVSWDNVQEFLKKVGNGFRLPTEAEWEYAARAGTTTAYSFGDSESQLGDYAWFSGNAGGKTHPVGGKKPNLFGLFDMHGNVWEWCSDWYDYSYYAECQRQGTVTDPSGPSSGSRRVRRGGSWLINAVYCRSASRFNYAPGRRNDDLGFRLVRVGR